MAEPIPVTDVYKNLPAGPPAESKPMSVDDVYKNFSAFGAQPKKEDPKLSPIERGSIEAENKRRAGGQFTSPYFESYSKDKDLGEVHLDDADRVHYKDEKGDWNLTNSNKHVVLRNPDTGKYHVFERSSDTDYGPILGRAMGIGGLVQEGMASTTPVTGGTAALTAAQKALQASKAIEETTKVAVPISKAAISTNPVANLAAKGASIIPGANAPFAKAAAGTEQGLAAASEEAASSVGHTTTPADTGEVARGGLQKYVAPKREGGRLANKVADAYDKVDGLVDQTATNPLNNTRKVAQDIVSEAAAREAPQEISPAVKEVLGAATNPKGLTYESLKSLRSKIGEMLDSTNSDISKQELQRLYRGLSDDLRVHIQTHGGDRAVTVWERANTMAAAAAKRRDQLSTILGTERRSDEATFNAILKAASTGGGANVKLLATARKALQPDEWGEVVGGAIRHLGKDTKGEFDAGKFLRDYAKMSAEGKNVLFGESALLRKTLDNIATVAETFPKINKLGGGSGETAHTGLIGLLLHDPVKAIATVLGGKALSGMLARPASAEGMSKFMQSYKVLAMKPTKANLVIFNNAANAWNKDAAEEDRQHISELTDTIAGAARKTIVGLSPFGEK